jgi:hypothetical protein
MPLLREGRASGVEAYDCHEGEDVLLVPWAFGLEGDNPMASELCPHIGLQGTFFCRICNVRGKDIAGRGRSDAAELERRIDFMKVSYLAYLLSFRSWLKVAYVIPSFGFSCRYTI